MLAIVIVPEVLPADMVNVPFASVKSVPPPVAVPVTAKSTVISFAEAADKSTVTAFELTDSAPLEAVTLKSTVGAASLSVMV